MIEVWATYPLAKIHTRKLTFGTEIVVVVVNKVSRKLSVCRSGDVSSLKTRWSWDIEMDSDGDNIRPSVCLS